MIISITIALTDLVIVIFYNSKLSLNDVQGLISYKKFVAIMKF